MFMTSGEVPILPDQFTETQQRFSDFISKRAKPVNKILTDAVNIHEVTLSVKPRGLVPVDEIHLSKYVCTHDSEGEPLEERYTTYYALLNNTKYGTDTFLGLDTLNGFRYRGDGNASEEDMPEEDAKPIIEALFAADEAGDIKATD